MPRYMLAYYGGDKPSSKEEGARHFARFQEWIKNLGSAVIEPGTPLKGAKKVTLNGVLEGRAEFMSGFSVIEVEDMEAALKLASNCPLLDINGTIEVAEMLSMGGGH